MYHLLLGDRSYSSWSLRGWLLFEKFGISRKEQYSTMYTEQFHADVSAFFPARTVPALRLESGLVISDSLAIAEELASRHPEAGHWPKDPDHRAIARHLAAEMHSSFGALRDHCPMNLRTAYTDCTPPQGVLDDLTRLETLWSWARAKTQSATPWLCGEYCVADVFYAPIAARIVGYGLLSYLQDPSYVESHMADSDFQRWRALGLTEGIHQAAYDLPYPQIDFPVPTHL